MSSQKFVHYVNSIIIIIAKKVEITQMSINAYKL